MLAGQPSGLVLNSSYEDDMADEELRVAFDFDGVLADDEAEIVFHETGQLSEFHKSELEKVLKAHNPGPLKELLVKIAALQARERTKPATDPSYVPKVRIAILTAKRSVAQKNGHHSS